MGNARLILLGVRVKRRGWREREGGRVDVVDESESTPVEHHTRGRSRVDRKGDLRTVTSPGLKLGVVGGQGDTRLGD